MNLRSLSQASPANGAPPAPPVVDSPPAPPPLPPAPGGLRSVFSGAPGARRPSLRALRDRRQTLEDEPHLDEILYGRLDSQPTAPL
eukprot:gene19016-25607_t